jgi:single-strand DNA-binding protein
MSSRSLNKSFIVGYVGAAPQVRYTPNGKAVANLRVATSSSWKDRETGERKEHTEWHNLVFFDSLAELVQRRVSKGSRIHVEGSMRTRFWDDKETQQRRNVTEVVGRDLILLDPPTASDGTPSAAPPSEEAPPMDYDDIPATEH